MDQHGLGTLQQIADEVAALDKLAINARTPWDKQLIAREAQELRRIWEMLAELSNDPDPRL